MTARVAALLGFALVLITLRASAGELYVQGGLAWQVPHGQCTGDTSSYCLYDRTDVGPLLGHVELGYDMAHKNWHLSLYARHESEPSHRDFGVNQVGVSLRRVLWRSP